METTIVKKTNKLFYVLQIFLLIIISGLSGFGGSFLFSKINTSNTSDASSTKIEVTENIKVVDEDSAVILVAEDASESVVSIVVTKDIPLYEDSPYTSFEDYFLEDNNRNQTGTEQRQVGAGTGFFVSSDGLIVTNRHVVDAEDAGYTVILNDGARFEAEVLGRDTLLDIAFLEVKDVSQEFNPLNLGKSDSLKVGQKVIAFGNALGEFSNSVSLGIVSGLGRNIVASDQSGGNSSRLYDVIQTDASINFGNSGGPLLDIQGNVIGVNVAVATQAENISFAIPIDYVADLIDRLNKSGNIERPLLGVRYQMINAEIAADLDISVEYGALISAGNSRETSIVKDSPADIAGLKEDDIILEIDSTKLNEDNPLFNVVQSKRKGDIINLKILRGEKEIEIKVKL